MAVGSDAMTRHSVTALLVIVLPWSRSHASAEARSRYPTTPRRYQQSRRPVSSVSASGFSTTTPTDDSSSAKRCLHTDPPASAGSEPGPAVRVGESEPFDRHGQLTQTRPRPRRGDDHPVFSTRCGAEALDAQGRAYEVGRPREHSHLSQGWLFDALRCPNRPSAPKHVEPSILQVAGQSDFTRAFRRCRLPQGLPQVSPAWRNEATS